MLRMEQINMFIEKRSSVTDEQCTEWVNEWIVKYSKQWTVNEWMVNEWVNNEWTIKHEQWTFSDNSHSPIRLQNVEGRFQTL